MESSKQELQTRKEVAEKLRVSYPTLAKWRKLGILPAVVIGTRVRYKQSDIESLLTSNPPIND
jgi:excisionase family DNA binding protein